MNLKTLIAAAALTLPLAAHAANVELLNVSYDPTRELYKDFNQKFAEHWKSKTGDTVTIHSPTAAPASRRVRSSTAWPPTW